MEERVGLSKAAGQAPSGLLPCQPAALLQFLGHCCPKFRLLGRVLESYLLGKASLTLPHPQQVLSRVAGMLGEKEGWGSPGQEAGAGRGAREPLRAADTGLPLRPFSPRPSCCL